MLMPLSNGKLVFEGKYAKIPTNTQGALARYIENKILPGGFLCAVLRNDLFSAVGHADSGNLSALTLIVEYIHNNLPSSCYGSREAINRYAERREGREAA
jgi:hypothetical protein